MAYERRMFAGGAVGTTLTVALSSSGTAITIASASGWPNGTPNYAVIIGRGTATEEKCMISGLVGLVLTVVSRGIDGTAGGAHASGSTIELCMLARDLDEPNAHIADTTLDHHSQYLNNARHDITARHTFGAAYGTPAAASDVGTVAAAGTAAGPSRADHVHKLAAGSVNSAGVLATGVVTAAAILDGTVGTAEMADVSVTTAKLVDGSVTTAKLGLAAVTTAKIFTAAITPGKLEASLPLGSLGYATVNAAQTGIDNTPVAITGMTVTVTPFSATRILRISARVRWYETSAGDVVGQVLTFIKEGATTLGQHQTSYAGASPLLVAERRDTHTPVCLVVNPTLAAHTYTIWIRTEGTGAVISTEVSPENFILVEDIGGT